MSVSLWLYGDLIAEEEEEGISLDSKWNYRKLRHYLRHYVVADFMVGLWVRPHVHLNEN